MRSQQYSNNEIYLVDYLSDIADSWCSLYRLANVAFTAFSIAMKWVAVGVLVVWFSTIFIAFWE